MILLPLVALARSRSHPQHAPMGEKLKPPTDLLGALVASQMDVEAEESLVTGNKGSGLKDSEIIGNICEWHGHEPQIKQLGRVALTLMPQGSSSCESDCVGLVLSSF
jgi:hypothetical protein